MNSEKGISNQTKETQVEEIIRSKIICCPICGNKRIEMKPAELPESAKESLMDKLNMADYFLFCLTCEDYSLSLNGDVFSL